MARLFHDEAGRLAASLAEDQAWALLARTTPEPKPLLPGMVSDPSLMGDRPVDAPGEFSPRELML